MQNKREYIQNLKKVKLVIGNGFDLQCGLKTKYRDFFLNNGSKNSYFKTWINDFKDQVRYYLNFNVTNHKDFWKDFYHFDDTNIWDFFFYLVADIKPDSPQNWKWCDIEQVMEYSLYNYKDKGYRDSIYNWQCIYDIINGKAVKYDDSLYILAAVVYKKNDEKQFRSIEKFYSFLLSELRLFEINFGKYILSQYYSQYNVSFGVIEKNALFYKNVERTIKSLCNIDNLSSVDSFNYGIIEIDKIKKIFHNINGTVDYPIFGIDSSAFLPPDPRYIFCKTNRRMELDMLEYEAYEREEFENVIIYGHSLTVSDYSYFFSLLDKLDIVNFTKKSVIVFAYSVYDKEKEEQIKSDYRLAISNLFKEYSKYKGNSEYPNRLLDALTTQGKVLLYEI